MQLQYGTSYTDSLRLSYQRYMLQKLETLTCKSFFRITTKCSANKFTGFYL